MLLQLQVSLPQNISNIGHSQKFDLLYCATSINIYCSTFIGELEWLKCPTQLVQWAKNIYTQLTVEQALEHIHHCCWQLSFDCCKSLWSQLYFTEDLHTSLVGSCCKAPRVSPNQANLLCCDISVTCMR